MKKYDKLLADHEEARHKYLNAPRGVKSEREAVLRQKTTAILRIETSARRRRKS